MAVEIWRRAARMTQRCLRPLIDPELTIQNNRGVQLDAAADAAEYGEDLAEAAEIVER